MDKDLKYINKDDLIDDLIPIFNRLSPKDKGDIMEVIYNQKQVSVEKNTYDLEELTQAKDIIERRTTIPGDGYFYEDIEIAYSFVEDLLDDLIKQNGKESNDVER